MRAQNKTSGVPATVSNTNRWDRPVKNSKPQTILEDEAMEEEELSQNEQVTSEELVMSSPDSQQEKDARAFGAETSTPKSIPQSDDKQQGVLAEAQERISKMLGHGFSLTQPFAGVMEKELGTSMGRVRIHDSAESQELAKLLQVPAFTVGHDIFLGASRGQFRQGQGLVELREEIYHATDDTSEKNTIYTYDGDWDDYTNFWGKEYYLILPEAAGFNSTKAPVYGDDGKVLKYLETRTYISVVRRDWRNEKKKAPHEGMVLVEYKEVDQYSPDFKYQLGWMYAKSLYKIEPFIDLSQVEIEVSAGNFSRIAWLNQAIRQNAKIMKGAVSFKKTAQKLAELVPNEPFFAEMLSADQLQAYTGLSKYVATAQDYLLGLGVKIPGMVKGVYDEATFKAITKQNYEDKFKEDSRWHKWAFRNGTKRTLDSKILQTIYDNTFNRFYTPAAKQLVAAILEGYYDIKNDEFKNVMLDNDKYIAGARDPDITQTILFLLAEDWMYSYAPVRREFYTNWSYSHIDGVLDEDFVTNATAYLEYREAAKKHPDNYGGRSSWTGPGSNRHSLGYYQISPLVTAQWQQQMKEENKKRQHAQKLFTHAIAYFQDDLVKPLDHIIKNASYGEESKNNEFNLKNLRKKKVNDAYQNFAKTFVGKKDGPDGKPLSAADFKVMYEQVARYQQSTYEYNLSQRKAENAVDSGDANAASATAFQLYSADIVELRKKRAEDFRTFLDNAAGNEFQEDYEKEYDRILTHYKAEQDKAQEQLDAKFEEAFANAEMENNPELDEYTGDFLDYQAQETKQGRAFYTPRQQSLIDQYEELSQQIADSARKGFEAEKKYLDDSLAANYAQYQKNSTEDFVVHKDDMKWFRGANLQRLNGYLKDLRDTGFGYKKFAVNSFWSIEKAQLLKELESHTGRGGAGKELGEFDTLYQSFIKDEQNVIHKNLTEEDSQLSFEIGYSSKQYYKDLYIEEARVEFYHYLLKFLLEKNGKPTNYAIKSWAQEYQAFVKERKAYYNGEYWKDDAGWKILRHVTGWKYKEDYRWERMVDLYDDADQFLEDIMDYPDEGTSAWDAFWSGMGDGAWYNKIPFIGGLFGMADSYQLMGITDKIEAGEPLDDWELALFESYAARQQLEKVSPSSFAFDLGKGVGEALPFLLEFAVTGGVFTGAKKGVTKYVMKQLTKRLDNVIGDVAKKRIASSIGTVAGVGAQGSVNPTRMLDRTFELMTDQSTMQYQDGAFQFGTDPSSGKSGWEAFKKAAFENYMEYASERLGGMIKFGPPGAVSAVVRNAPEITDNIVISYLKRIGKIDPKDLVSKEKLLAKLKYIKNNKSVMEELSKVLAPGQYVEEYFEELVNNVANRTYDGENPFEFEWRDELLTVATIGIIGGGGHVTRFSRDVASSTVDLHFQDSDGGVTRHTFPKEVINEIQSLGYGTTSEDFNFNNFDALIERHDAKRKANGQEEFSREEIDTLRSFYLSDIERTSNSQFAIENSGHDIEQYKAIMMVMLGQNPYGSRREALRDVKNGFQDVADALDALDPVLMEPRTRKMLHQLMGQPSHDPDFRSKIAKEVKRMAEQAKGTDANTISHQQAKDHLSEFMLRESVDPQFHDLFDNFKEVGESSSDFVNRMNDLAGTQSLNEHFEDNAEKYREFMLSPQARQRARQHFGSEAQQGNRSGTRPDINTTANFSEFSRRFDQYYAMLTDLENLDNSNREGDRSPQEVSFSKLAGLEQVAMNSEMHIELFYQLTETLVADPSKIDAKFQKKIDKAVTAIQELLLDNTMSVAEQHAAMTKVFNRLKRQAGRKRNEKRGSTNVNFNIVDSALGQMVDSETLIDNGTFQGRLEIGEDGALWQNGEVINQLESTIEKMMQNVEATNEFMDFNGIDMRYVVLVGRSNSKSGRQEVMVVSVAEGDTTTLDKAAKEGFVPIERSAGFGTNSLMESKIEEFEAEHGDNSLVPGQQNMGQEWNRRNKDKVDMEARANFTKLLEMVTRFISQNNINTQSGRESVVRSYLMDYFQMKPGETYRMPFFGEVRNISIDWLIENYFNPYLNLELSAQRANPLDNSIELSTIEDIQNSEQDVVELIESLEAQAQQALGVPIVNFEGLSPEVAAMVTAQLSKLMNRFDQFRRVTAIQYDPNASEVMSYNWYTGILVIGKLGNAKEMAKQASADNAAAQEGKTNKAYQHFFDLEGMVNEKGEILDYGKMEEFVNYVVTHEFAHAVHKQLFDHVANDPNLIALVNEFHRIWEAGFSTEGASAVSRYATQENVDDMLTRLRYSEAFAESFAMYMMQEVYDTGAILPAPLQDYFDRLIPQIENNNFRPDPATNNAETPPVNVNPEIGKQKMDQEVADQEYRGAFEELQQEFSGSSFDVSSDAKVINLTQEQREQLINLIKAYIRSNYENITYDQRVPIIIQNIIDKIPAIASVGSVVDPFTGLKMTMTEYVTSLVDTIGLTTTSTTFTDQSSVSEVEAWLEHNLGLHEVNLDGMDLQMANMLGSQLTLLYAKMGPALSITLAKVKFDLKEDIMSYNPIDRVMTIGAAFASEAAAIDAIGEGVIDNEVSIDNGEGPIGAEFNFQEHPTVEFFMSFTLVHESGHAIQYALDLRAELEQGLNAEEQVLTELLDSFYDEWAKFGKTRQAQLSKYVLKDYNQSVYDPEIEDMADATLSVDEYLDHMEDQTILFDEGFAEAFAYYNELHSIGEQAIQDDTLLNDELKDILGDILSFAMGN